MMKSGDACTLERERALAVNLERVAAELRLFDAQDLVAFIRLEMFGNVGNLVNSSTELYFKPGTLKFGMSGDVELAWGKPPRVMLDMEFANQGVLAYFRLILDAVDAAIEITYLSFPIGSSGPSHNTERLVSALSDARLPQRRASRLAELADAQQFAAVQ